MTDRPLQIPIAELRRLLEVALHHVENTAGDVVAVDKDYFWSIPPEELYDVYNQRSGMKPGGPYATAPTINRTPAPAPAAARRDRPARGS